MLTNLLWLLAGVAIAAWWFRRSSTKQDYYVVETVGIMDDVEAGLSEIGLISGGSVGMSVLYDVTRDGRNYAVRRKGQQQIVANKSFEVFDDYAAAREKFDQIDRLFLSVRTPGWAAHKILLWTVTAGNRDAVPELLVRANGNQRKLAETDYASLLKMYTYNNGVVDE